LISSSAAEGIWIPHVLRFAQNGRDPEFFNELICTSFDKFGAAVFQNISDPASHEVMPSAKAAGILKNLSNLTKLSLEFFGQVAQSVEQRPEKPCVASSILALST
jgi:hypothetical protein